MIPPRQLRRWNTYAMASPCSTDPGDGKQIRVSGHPAVPRMEH